MSEPRRLVRLRPHHTTTLFLALHAFVSTSQDRPSPADPARETLPTDLNEPANPTPLIPSYTSSPGFHPFVPGSPPQPTDLAGLNDLTTTDLAPGTTPTSPHSGAGSGGDDHDDGVLNYYFLLLAVLVVFICILYYTLTKRRRLASLQARSSQQRALSQDLSNNDDSNAGAGMTGRLRRWRPGMGSRDSGYGGRQEGLDERGEAPPPYVKEPDRAHLRSRNSAGTEGVELGDWNGRSKPPDYDEAQGGMRRS